MSAKMRMTRGAALGVYRSGRWARVLTAMLPLFVREERLRALGAGANKPFIVALAAAVAVTLALVFAHSFQGSAGSWMESNVVASLLEPVLRRLYGLFNRANAWAGLGISMGYEAFVRKAAHFAEYALLGAECAGLTVLLSRRVVSPYLWADLFIVLMAAVLDEFLQGFVGRTSLTGDVLLDFSGALVGIAVVLVVAAIVKGRTQKGS